MSVTPDSTLANPEQLIAYLQRQLAECRAERDEAQRQLAERTIERDDGLAQQIATAEVLQVINSSPGDLAPVFDAILEKAMHLCGAAFGLMMIRAENGLKTAAARGVPVALADFLERHPIPGSSGSIAARLLAGEPAVHVLDLKDTQLYRDGHPLRSALVDLGGIRTLVNLGLRREEEVVGAICIYRQEVRPFSNKEIALLQNFAAQAVIAMENARLITETREALEQQTATAEVLQVINSSPGDLTPVFDAMLEKALRLCEAEIGTLWMADGEQSRAVANRGAPPAYLEFLNKGPHPRPTFAGGIVHVADIRQTELYRDGNPLVRVGADLGGVRTILAVPLRKDEAELGRFSIYRTDVRPFTDKQIALLENFAAQAVIAMENARLITETREALAQQTATAEVLQVINSSPGDLAPVFDAILDKAHSLCGSTHGSMQLCDGDHFRAVALRGIPEPFAVRLQQGFRGTETPASQPLLAGERFVHIPDLADVDHPVAQAAVELASSRTLLSVPLRKEGVLLGAISAARTEVKPFSDKEIALLENFAGQAVIAMENARLLGELRQRTEEVAELNRGLEARVAEQVDELGRVGRLKRFLAPQLAELIVSQGDEKILESHRREIVVVFCDLRGYTAFTETAEPEEVLDFLREYHGALGPLVSQFEGTLDQFSGDGIMVFFNDPVPCPDPAERAVKMAVAMREAAGDLTAAWRRRGRVLGFGAGIAQGYATLGQIGFADRSGYTAIGTVCNLAARLCAEAKDGQILVAQRVAVAVEDTTQLEQVGELMLKGLTQPVVAYNVPLAATQPGLRVIEGGSQNV